MFRRLYPAIAAVAVSFSSAAAAEQPNILFILCDDLGYGDIGAFHQNQRAGKNDRSVPSFKTPQIDRMAAAGMKLTRHYAAAPVCAPSRASLLTGLTQGHANVRDNQFDKALAETHTLASVLKTAGYTTAAFGKWGLQGGGEGNADGVPGGPETRLPERWIAYPTRRGFDEFYGYVRHRDGHFHYPQEDQREVWENDHAVARDLDLCYTTDLFAARAKQWITRQAGAGDAKPFFVYLAFDTPHAKLQNPPCPFPAGGGLEGGLQWTGKPHAMINTASGTMDGWMHPDFANATWDHDHDPATAEIPWPDAQKRYANGVRRIDDSVGDLLQLLVDLKIADHTLVVFTSDNGPSQESYLPNEPFDPNFFDGFGPFDGIKRDTWEGGLREPTVAWWPGRIKAGGESAKPAGHWDWLATFAEMAGLPVPAATDGVSLLPDLTGKGTRREGILYTEYSVNGRTPDYLEFEPSHRKRQRGQMQAVYAGDLKAVRYQIQSADQDFEIYDVAKDPKETTDLAAKPEFASLQKQFKARALQVRKPDPAAKRPYDGAFVPALETEPTTAAGFRWASSQGSWPWLPDFRTLQVTASGTATTLTAGEEAGIAISACFHAPADGEYTFQLASNGGCMLFLHDIRVIGESNGGTAEGSVRLKAGWHPLRLWHRRLSAPANLSASVRFNGGEALLLDGGNLRQPVSPRPAGK